jgi:predicted enzyme related to lactoylglutathione lyase
MSDHGRYVWYELLTTDPEGAKAFYSKVVGWVPQDMPMPGMTYTLLTVDGQGQAGLMGFQPHMPAGIPPNWTGYVAVDDCDAAVEKASALGGSLMNGPMDIPNVGRFAIIADPSGGVLAIMKPTPPEPPGPPPPPHTPGTTGWHELYGADPATGFDFYGDLFGWKKDGEMDMGPMGKYQLFRNQDGQVGGMMRRPEAVPVSCWLYYFWVDEIDAAAARVTESGGAILMGPMQVPTGDWVLQGKDPQGAVFALLGPKKG